MDSELIKRENYQSPVGKSPFVYAGYKCNNNCIFCFEKDNVISKKSFEEIKKEINIIKNNYDYINIMGREPTLREDLSEIIKYCKKLNFKQIGITTNGRMFAYDKFAKEVIKSGLNQIVLTVVGHNKKLHDSHTLVEGSFEQSAMGIKNILNIKDDNLSLVINVMVTKKNYKELFNIIKFYINLGVRELNIGHILPYNKLINTKDCIAMMIDVVPYLIKSQEKFSGIAKLLFVEYPPCVFKKEFRHLSFPCLEENPEKKRINICSNCGFIKKCDGIPSKYLKLYGDKEFCI